MFTMRALTTPQRHFPNNDETDAPMHSTTLRSSNATTSERWQCPHHCLMDASEWNDPSLALEWNHCPLFSFSFCQHQKAPWSVSIRHNNNNVTKDKDNQKAFSKTQIRKLWQQNYYTTQKNKRKSFQQNVRTTTAARGNKIFNGQQNNFSKPLTWNLESLHQYYITKSLPWKIRISTRHDKFRTSM